MESRHLHFDRHLFSPEIAVGVLLPARFISLDAHVYGTFRREGPGPSCSHCAEYDYDEYLVGVRVSATLTHALLPLTFIAGLARGVTIGRVDPGSAVASAASDFRLSGVYADAGIGLQFVIGKHLLVRPTCYGDVWLGPELIPGRLGFGIGVGYLL